MEGNGAAMAQSYDIARVRGLYPGVSDGWTYLNAHAHPHTAERVNTAVSRTFRTAALIIPEDSTASTGSRAAHRAPGVLGAEHVAQSARRAIADLTASRANRVVIGPNLAVLYRWLVRAMAPLFRRGSTMVPSFLDDPGLNQALSSEFLLVSGAGTQAQSRVRWAYPDLGTGELPPYQYRDIVDGSTRLVSFGAAHPLLGTVAASNEIIEQVRQRSRAWTLMDISALAAYRGVEAVSTDADIIALDLAVLGGPQLAALVFRDSAMFARLDATTLDVPELAVPVALLGAVAPLAEHVAELGAAEGSGSRRLRIERASAALTAYTSELSRDLYGFLGTLPAVHILGASGEAAAEATAEHIPRLSFVVQGVSAQVVHRRLLDNGLVTTLTPATPALEAMGLGEVDGAVTASLSPFSTHHDIAHLTRVVASLA